MLKRKKVIFIEKAKIFAFYFKIIKLVSLRSKICRVIFCGNVIVIEPCNLSFLKVYLTIDFIALVWCFLGMRILHRRQARLFKQSVIKLEHVFQ